MCQYSTAIARVDSSWLQGAVMRAAIRMQPYRSRARGQRSRRMHRTGGAYLRDQPDQPTLLSAAIPSSSSSSAVSGLRLLRLLALWSSSDSPAAMGVGVAVALPFSPDVTKGAMSLCEELGSSSVHFGTRYCL